MSYSFISNSGVEHFLEVEIVEDNLNNNEEAAAHVPSPSTSTIQVHLTLIIHPFETNQTSAEDLLPHFSRQLDYSQFSYEDPSFCPNISTILSSHGFDNDERAIDWYAERIITVGREFIDQECRNSHTGAVHLMIEIWKVDHMMEDGERRAVRESLEEFERRNCGRVAASEAAVESLKKVVVGVEKKEMNCGVCLEEVEVGKIGMMMPCHHGFHGDCIVKWLKESHLCPLCRYELPKVSDSI